MRFSPVAILLVVSVFVSGCGPWDVEFTFDNRSDAALCDYTSQRDAEGARCNGEIAPHSNGRGGRDCDGKSSRKVTVIITVKQTGREIYNRTARCGDWDGHGKFVIEQVGDEFVATDELEP